MVKLQPFVPPTVSCAVNTPCLFTNRASFELAERNGFLKSLFDGEPNLFSPLKSLLQRSETPADVSGGAHPERRAAVPRPLQTGSTSIGALCEQAGVM